MEWGLAGIKDLVNLHPLFTHFPVALLISAFAFYLLGILLRKDHFFKTGQWTLFLGTLGAAAAVWTGHEAAETVAHDESAHAIIMAHQNLGFAVLALSVLLSLWLLISRSSFPKPKAVFLAGLFLIVAVLLQQVDLGGRLVFFHGVGMGRKSVIAAEKAEPAAHHEHGHEHHASES